MEIIRGISNVPGGNSALVSVGSFDGVHVGHQRILRLMKKQSPGLITVLTFDPHPQSVIRRDFTPLPMLTNASERIALLESFGVQRLVLAKFDLDFAQMSPEEFVSNVLLDKLGMTGIFVGPNHHFGRNRQGDVEMLRKLGSLYGFSVNVVEPILSGGLPVSSSRIRKTLLAGNTRQALSWLTRPFYLIGEVIHGIGRGRKLGFPTANQKLTDKDKLLPPAGIYSSITEWNGMRWPSVTHIGPRPTFPSDESTFETHIIGFDDDIYGRILNVGLIHRMRDIVAFENVKKLIFQMKLDCEDAVLSLAQAGFGYNSRLRSRRLRIKE